MALRAAPSFHNISRAPHRLGRDFAANALSIAAEREGHRLTGFAGLPTLNRGTSAGRTRVQLARRRTRTRGVTLIPGTLHHAELAEEIRFAAEDAGY